MKTRLQIPFSVALQFVVITAILALHSGKTLAQNYFLDFENQPNGTTEWQENGYFWQVQGPLAGIFSGPASGGNGVFRLGTGVSGFSACGPFNLQGLKIRSDIPANNLQRFKLICIG